MASHGRGGKMTRPGLFSDFVDSYLGPVDPEEESQRDQLEAEDRQREDEDRAARREADYLRGEDPDLE